MITELFLPPELSDGIPMAVSSAVFGEGIGPIFLDLLECIGIESELLNCSSGRPFGITECTHKMDIGVRCPGKLCQIIYFIIDEKELLHFFWQILMSVEQVQILVTLMQTAQI